MTLKEVLLKMFKELTNGKVDSFEDLEQYFDRRGVDLGTLLDQDSPFTAFRAHDILSRLKDIETTLNAMHNHINYIHNFLCNIPNGFPIETPPPGNYTITTSDNTEEKAPD